MNDYHAHPSIWHNDLLLSVRTSNALTNNGIHTIRELLVLEDDTMMSLRGFGRKAYDEVMSALASLPEEDINTLMDKSYENANPTLLELSNADTFLVSIDNIDLSVRTRNALVNGGIYTLSDLLLLSKDELGDFRGLGAKGLRELFDNDTIGPALRGERASNIKDALDFHDYVIKSLNQRQILAIDRYYGLNGEPATLQIVGDSLGVTRERARQIIKAGLKKIKRATEVGKISSKIKEALIEAAKVGLPISEIVELSPVYSNNAVAAIFADIFPDVITIYKNPNLETNWVVHDANAMDEIIKNCIHALRLQVGPVSINDLVRTYKLPELCLYDLSGVTIQKGMIVLNSNRRALGNDRVYEIEKILDKTVRPMSVSELASIFDQRENVIRSTLDRVPGAVNVGRSMYALKKYGYTDKSTVQIIHDLLSEEGQPLPAQRIIDYVQKYRLISEGAVQNAISVEPDVFSRLDDGYVALTEWGYEPTSIAYKRLEIPAIEAILSVLDREEKALTQREVLEKVINEYGSRSTNSLATISASLKKLVEKGSVEQLGTRRSPFYTTHWNS